MSPTGAELRTVLVVGASLAGLRACERLRTAGFAGDLVLIGAERHLPYDRPPLSKRILAGAWEVDRATLRAPEQLAELGLDLRLGEPAAGLDGDGRAVVMAGGDLVPYDGLIVATGATPRRLPDQPADVHVLRTRDDAVALRDAIAGGARSIAVVGAGFIGLEVAATAASLGVAATVVEAAPAPLVRALGPELGAAAVAPLAEAGVTVRCGVSVEAVDADGVTLGGGERLTADVVVVGVGVRPATDWLAGSGLTLDDGVVCDETLATGLPGVYAAGDLARWPHRRYGELLRLEHWTNAAEQGAAAATNLLASATGGAGTPYDEVPFFWSDMGRHRIQLLGRPATEPDDVVEVVNGRLDQRAFLVLFGRGDRLRGVLGVNAAKHLMAYRALLVADDSLTAARELAATQPPL